MQMPIQFLPLMMLRLAGVV
uniref:Uncharacterized protein n=1 Tax=Arundo donax TaxID=35708 RepID=A0A0A8Y9V0_ARUDO